MTRRRRPFLHDLALIQEHRLLAHPEPWLALSCDTKITAAWPHVLHGHQLLEADIPHGQHLIDNEECPVHAGQAPRSESDTTSRWNNASPACR